MEKHKASPELQKFFERLLALKAKIKDTICKQEYFATKPHINDLKEIFNELHEIIKEEGKINE